jgi:hypothetical protein
MVGRVDFGFEVPSPVGDSIEDTYSGSSVQAAVPTSSDEVPESEAEEDRRKSSEETAESVAESEGEAPPPRVGGLKKR